MKMKNGFMSALAAVVCATGARADVSASAFYSQVDLVAHYDGIDNAGTGTHDPGATTWKDLSGNGRDLAQYGGNERPTVVPTGVGFSSATNMALGFVSEPNILDSNQKLTLELVAVADLTSGTHGILSMAPADAAASYAAAKQAAGLREGSSVFRISAGADYSSGISWSMQRSARGKLFVAAVRDGTNLDFYQGGLYYSRISSGLPTTVIATKAIVLGGAPHADYTNGFAGVVHGFRIYSRPLTTNEIYRHALIDRKRFLTDEPGSWMRTSEGKAELLLKVSAKGGGEVRIGDGGAAASTNAWFEAFGAAPTLTAAALPGHSFRFWQGDLDDLDLFARTNRTITLPSNAPREVRAVFAADGGPTAATYARDGLVLQYDGEENAGFGLNDGFPASWTDLSGYGQHTTRAGRRQSISRVAS